jgi:DnaD/phage-associated family protein
MFSLKIVDTDAFMDMPLSAQALYFHLAMHADDDGFLGNAKRIQRQIGASEEDMDTLLRARFLLRLGNIIVIKHWYVNNYIRSDRYTQTTYQEEKSLLYIKKNGAYTDHAPENILGESWPSSLFPGESLGRQNDNQTAYQMATKRETNGIPSDNQTGDKRYTQVRLGKDNNISGGGDAHAREKFQKSILDYLQIRGKLPESYYGVSESLLGDAEMITQSIFQRFANRLPTEEDVANVFLAIRHSECSPNTKEWTTIFPKDKCNLLMYAFENAANAGKPGNWKYIHGILRNLKKRGIETLEQAETYDVDRDMKSEGWC